MINFNYLIIQMIVILLFAPLVNGVIRKVKAFTQKRRGAPLFQIYFDLYKLFNKSSVVSDKASWIFSVTPYIVFSTALVAALFIPVTNMISTTGFLGDIIVFVYLLSLGRFFMMLSALDTGGTFGGMGSSREAMISSLIEPSILVSLFTLGLIFKSMSIVKIIESVNLIDVPMINPIFIMILLALLIIIIAETSRIPVDDPATHLELTMVHEAMILEYSGRHLALIEYGSLIKQLSFITLLVNVFMPHDVYLSIIGISSITVSILIYFIKVLLVSVLIALIEVSTVKLRLFSIPNLAAIAFILSFLGFLQYFVIGG